MISSPLKRAKKTAQIVNEYQQKPIMYDKRIIERGCGELEGLLCSQFNYKDYWNYKIDTPYEGAISLHDFVKNIGAFLDEIKQTYPDKNILIATHNGVCRAINAYFPGIPEDGDLEIYCQENCEIREYEI